MKLEFPHKIKEILYISIALVLSIYPKEWKGYQREICTTIFTATLLTIAEI
jgi:hypothetical protein